MKALVESLEIEEAGIMEASLCENSKEVSHYIGGGIVRTLPKKTECDSYSRLLINCDSSASQTGSYLQNLSRGGLTNPSEEMSESVCTIFAQTELIDGHMKGKPSVRSVCCLALGNNAPQ